MDNHTKPTNASNAETEQFITQTDPIINTKHTTPLNTVNENIDLIQEFLDNNNKTTARDRNNIKNDKNIINSYQNLTNKILYHGGEIKKLYSIKSSKKIPKGLTCKAESRITFSRELKVKWNNTLLNASISLIEIIIEHHQSSINNLMNERGKLRKHLTAKQIFAIDEAALTARKRKREDNDLIETKKQKTNDNDTLTNSNNNF